MNTFKKLMLVAAGLNCCGLYKAQTSNFNDKNIGGISVNSNDEAKKLTLNCKKYTNLSSVDFNGKMDSSIVAVLLGELSHNKIKELSIKDPADNFPVTLLKNFSSLSKLEYTSCGENEKEELVASVSSLPLTSFSFSVTDAALIPDNLSLLQRLDSIRISVNEFCDEISSDRKEISFHIKGINDKKIKVSVIASNQNFTDEDKEELKNSFASDNSNKKKADNNSNEKPFIRKYKNVSPPIAGANVPVKIYSVNAKAGGTLIYEKSGTEITIPSDAFVDAKGNAVKGNVQIDYREYRTSEDILVSGIPMAVNKNGEKGNMESAGMFEINASQNGKEIFVAKEKKIEVALVPTDTLENGYNFYSYNTKAGDWTNNGRIDGSEEAASNENSATDNSLNAKKDSVDVFEFSLATKIFRTNIAYPQKAYDTTHFADRFYSSKHDFTINRLVPVTKITVFNKRKSRKTNLVRPTHIRKNHDGEILCNLRYFHKCNPELAAFSGLTWKIEGIASTAEFRSKITGGKRFSDVRVEENGDSYTIKMKQRGKIIEFNAAPVFLNNKDSVIELKDGGKRKFKLYSRKLRNRERVFERKLALGSLTNNQYTDTAQFVAKKEFAYSKALSKMLAEEKLMDKKTWMNKGFEIKKRIPLAQYNNPGNTFYDDRNFSVRASVNGLAVGVFKFATLGLFNCDRMYFEPPAAQTINAFANFKSAGGELLKVKSLYTVYKKGVVVKNNPDSPLILRKNSKAGFMIVTTDGKVAVKKYGEVNDLASGVKGRMTIDVTVLEETVTDPNQLKKYVGVR